MVHVQRMSLIRGRWKAETLGHTILRIFAYSMYQRIGINESYHYQNVRVYRVLETVQNTRYILLQENFAKHSAEA
jgi:hypothetical protein